MPNAFRILTLLLAVAAASDSRSTGPGSRPAPDEPAVVVDYSTRAESYRVTGDATLLSLRFTPGTTVDLIIAAAALETGALMPEVELPTREGAMRLPEALKDSSDEFFAQVLKRTGYAPVRQLLLRTRYTPGIPEAVASFTELARGEPLRVTVFEQNLFLQAFVKREIGVRAEYCALLEKYLAVSSP